MWGSDVSLSFGLNTLLTIDRLVANEGTNGGDGSEELTAHINDKDNPHEVTAEQLNAVTYDDFVNDVESVFCDYPFRRDLIKSGDWWVATSNLWTECWGNIYGTYYDYDKTLVVTLPFNVTDDNENDMHVQLTLHRSAEKRIIGYYFIPAADVDAESYLCIEIDEDLPQDTESGATVSIYIAGSV